MVHILFVALGFAAVFYLLIGWCVTITNPEALIVAVDEQVMHHTGPRQTIGVLRVLLQRILTWPRWWR